MIERPDWISTEDAEPAPGGMDGGGVPTLLDRENAGLRDLDGADVAPALAADLDPDLVADWEKAGGLEHRLGVAHRVARQLVEAFPAADQSRFLADFEALPKSAQSAVLSELALEPDGAVRPASERDLTRFASTEEGGRLVSEWRGEAPRKLATLRRRIERILAEVEPSGAADVLARWFDELAPAVASEIYRALVR
jgi:hypothetical protein